MTPLTKAEADRLAANIPLAHWLVQQRHIPEGTHEYDEAVQDACVGLARAIRNHDPARGTLATYAYRVMLTEVARGVNKRRHGTVRRSNAPLPLSLDYPVSHEEGAAVLGDTLADNSVNVERDATNAQRLDDAAVAMLAACRDSLDFEVVATLFERGDKAGLSVDVAERTGANRRTVGKRLDRLTAVAREAVPA